MGKLDFLKKKTKSYVLSWDGVTEGKESFTQETGLNADTSKYASWYKISDAKVDSSDRIEALVEAHRVDNAGLLKEARYLDFTLNPDAGRCTLAYVNIDNCQTPSGLFYVRETTFPTAGWWIYAGTGATPGTVTIDINELVGINLIKVTNEPVYNISSLGNSTYASPFYEIRNSNCVDGNYYRFAYKSVPEEYEFEEIIADDGTEIYIGQEKSLLVDALNPDNVESDDSIMPTAEDLIKAGELLSFGKLSEYLHNNDDYTYDNMEYNILRASNTQLNYEVIRALGNEIGPCIILRRPIPSSGTPEFALLAVVKDTTKDMIEVTTKNALKSYACECFEISDCEFNKFIEFNKNKELYAKIISSKESAPRYSKLSMNSDNELKSVDYSKLLSLGFVIPYQTYLEDPSSKDVVNECPSIFFKSTIARDRYSLVWNGSIDGKVAVKSQSVMAPTMYKISDNEYTPRSIGIYTVLTNINRGDADKFLGIYNLYTVNGSDEAVPIYVVSDGALYVGSSPYLVYAPVDKYSMDMTSLFGPKAYYTFPEKGWYIADAVTIPACKIADIEVY